MAVYVIFPVLGLSYLAVSAVTGLMRWGFPKHAKTAARIARAAVLVVMFVLCGIAAAAHIGMAV